MTNTRDVVIDHCQIGVDGQRSETVDDKKKSFKEVGCPDWKMNFEQGNRDSTT